MSRSHISYIIIIIPDKTQIIPAEFCALITGKNPPEITRSESFGPGRFTPFIGKRLKTLSSVRRLSAAAYDSGICTSDGTVILLQKRWLWTTTCDLRLGCDQDLEVTFGQWAYCWKMTTYGHFSPSRLTKGPSLITSELIAGHNVVNLNIPVVYGMQDVSLDNSSGV